MRFIGNKENLMERIYQVMKSKKISGTSFFDFFAGTTSVGRFFKELNYTIYCSDLMYFSFVLQQAYIVNNAEPKFSRLVQSLHFQSIALFGSPLDKVIEFLNHIEPVEGFIYNNYTPGGTKNLEVPRMFFSDENGKKIDSIRLQIEDWKNQGLIEESEYYILLACLIETVPFYANISGVYAAFHKKWDPRAIKKLLLRPIQIVINDKTNAAFNTNSVELLNSIDADILYLDPPYNQRQYAPNYHLLETIAKYDYPTINGVGGLRDYQNQKSLFCNARTAIQELSKIAKNGNYKTMILSYNSEGIMAQNDIINTLSEYGKIDLVEIDYSRYKSNNNGESSTKKFIKEQLYILQKYE